MSRLREMAKEMQNGLPIMEGKEKGVTSELINREVVIHDYSFLEGDNGTYVVYTIIEEPEKYFFGGKVVTDILQRFDNKGLYDDIKSEGLPVAFKTRRSKNGFSYTDCELYPAG